MNPEKTGEPPRDGVAARRRAAFVARAPAGRNRRR